MWDSMWLNASWFLEFQIPVPTPFLLMLRPRSGWQQWIAREEYVLSPSVPAVGFTDPFGNLCQRLVAPAGHFSVRTSVDIETADASDTSPGAPFVEVQQLPDETLPFLYPSRYCESDRFTEMAASLATGRAPATINAMPSLIISATRYGTHPASDSGSSVPLS
jgi:transglutaminase-like putative cysteine protease